MLKLTLLLGLGVAGGCRDGDDDVSAAAATENAAAVTEGANSDGPQRFAIDVVDPWSFDVLSKNDETLLALISHSEDYLAVWSIDDRQPQQRAKEDTGFHPDNVIWFDWNGDGDVSELLLTVEGEKQVQLWELGFWGLKKTGSVTVEDAPQHVRAADFDQDGHIDLILGPYENYRMTLLWGKGDFAFEETHIDAWPIPVHPKITDWDGDGDSDIVWSEWEHGAVRWANNLGARRFETIELQTPEAGAPRQVDVVDVDEDGHADLIVSLEIGNAARVLYNDGSGAVRAREDIPAPTVGYSDAAVGRDRQGMLLALSEAEHVVLARRGDDGWRLRQLPATGLKMDLQLTDVDRDGEVDLLYAETAGEHVQIVYGPLWEQAEALP